MRVALVLLLALLRDDTRALRFCERSTFNMPEVKGDEAKKIVDLLVNREHWVDAYRTLEEKFGRFHDDLSVTVDFNLEGEELAHAGSRDNVGKISFNLKKLVEIEKRMVQIRAEQKEAEKNGKKFYFKVPPVRVERIIYHEMTHILQQNYDAPSWFIEGMAQLVGDDPNTMYAFAHSAKKVEFIDTPLGGREEIYARGHAFWKWLDSKGAARQAGALAIMQRFPWKEALEDATRMSWSDILAQEREWSGREFERLRSEKPR